MIGGFNAPLVEADKISRLSTLRHLVLASIFWTLAISIGMWCVPYPVVLGQADVSDVADVDPFQVSIEPPAESQSARAQRLFNEGKFADVIALAKINDNRLGEQSDEEKRALLIIQSHLALGEYGDARKSLDTSTGRFQYSIGLRWIGIEVCRFNNDIKRSIELSQEIAELASKASWKYRDVTNQVVLGKYFLFRGADAKEVLKAFYNPTKQRHPDDPEIFRAIADLAIEKHDYQLAAENYTAALKLAPNDTATLFGIAVSFRDSNSAKTNETIKSVLAINPNHVESLLLLTDQHISSERYDEAEKSLEQVFSVNPKHPIAWAYKSAIAHLANDAEKESEYRSKALADWSFNPEVDYVIGRELSQKYRFEEAEVYQRRALIFDKNYLPAKIQLAHDLLRLGQEMEGWKLADEVFNADQYSVVAHNLVTLRDQVSKFRTLEEDGFVVRMDAKEADIYGSRVLDLLSRAKRVLCKKYEAEIQTPIFVEIFPRQQDFAIRTFGLPGGSGFLGVCFGRVITMNSPAAQGANLTSWESVLWHEFCHVVTLQKTKNKMPRWLSEGISVYEEKLADPTWGESLNVAYREMMLGDELTPVSQLSGAFLRPKSPMHLQFAYYESSLVVEYLVDQFGIQSVLNVLNDLSIGIPINDALRRHCAPVEFIDKKFAGFATSRARSLAPDANWDEIEPMPNATGVDWLKWNADHPDNLMGLISEAKQWVIEKEWDRAVSTLEKVIQLSPETKSAYSPLALGYRELGNSEKEIEALERLAALDADDVDLFTRLLEIYSANENWEKTKFYARRLLAVNPLIVSPHRYLALAAEKTGDDAATIESLSVLANLNPLDPADLHFRLASALHRTKQLAKAKRQVVMALEQAPRYRDAHTLLLKIAQEQSASSNDPLLVQPDDPDVEIQKSSRPKPDLPSSVPPKDSP